MPGASGSALAPTITRRVISPIQNQVLREDQLVADNYYNISSVVR